MFASVRECSRVCANVRDCLNSVVPKMVTTRVQMRQTDIFKLPDGRHSAGRGLYLDVSDGGRYRRWLFRFQIDGKRKVYGLGSAKVLTLAAATKLADEYRQLLSVGKDPRKTEEAQTGHNFADVAKEAIESRAELRQWSNEKHAAQWTSTVNTYAVPVLGRLDVADITREQVLEVLRPIWKTKSETATRLRSRLEVIFDYALRKGWREKENPARWRGGLEFDLPPRNKVIVRQHFTAVDLNELQKAAVKMWEGATPAQLCMLFGALTATRCSEFALAEWSEIDLKKKIWSIPPERRKDRKQYPHRVPLSPWAIKVLKKLPSTEGVLFPGRTGRTVNVQSPRVLLSRLVGHPVTMHGCRSTFRDWCAETGKDNVLAEKSLMHTTGNAVEQAYQRSDLLEQRRGLMNEWADVVMRLCTDA